MKKAVILIFVFTVCSCNLFNKKGIDFVIKNNSNVEIENIKLYTSENLTVKDLESLSPNDSMEGFLPMTNNKKDGSYILEFNRLNKDKETHKQGYYSNGSPLNKWIQFNIKTNTTITRLSKASIYLDI